MSDFSCADDKGHCVISVNFLRSYAWITSEKYMVTLLATILLQRPSLFHGISFTLTHTWCEVKFANHACKLFLNDNVSCLTHLTAFYQSSVLKDKYFIHGAVNEQVLTL